MLFQIYRQKQTNLTAFTNQDQYISHKHALDEIATVRKVFPVSLWEKLGAYVNPINAYYLLRLKNYIDNYEQFRTKHNDQFVESELVRRAAFFNDIDGKSLDDQQRIAVIADEDNSLIIAGAGSGKTLTIVGKVKYLTEVLDIEPSSILSISFTKKSADSMEKRINVKGVDPMTFHKFGLSVLQDVEKRRPVIFDGSSNAKLFKELLRILSEDPDYLAKLNAFFISYIKIPRSQFEFESHGDYIQYMKDQNYSTYKKVKMLFKGKETYYNEKVKSIEECIIANFLIFNRVEYAYEAKYDFPFEQFSRQKSYKPDFTIITPSGEVYLEHLGMDKAGNVPPFFAKPNETQQDASRRYQRMLDWKRRTHEKNGTELVESYSYQFMDGTLLNTLGQNLTQAGVVLNPMDDSEVWEMIQKSAKAEVDAFLELVQTFLALLKSNDHSVADARIKSAESDVNSFLKERTEIFLDLFEKIYDAYEDNLKNNGEIDFNDMISLATHYIDEGKFHFTYDYVIIDEFQDLSFGRYRMLQAMRSQNPNVRFYCVGDDWQSIYRFAGSDIALFKDFDEHFGYTFKSRIETTYRFNEPLIGKSSDFILKNPNQTAKTLRAPEGVPETGYSIIESDTMSGDDTNSLVEAIEALLSKGLNPQSEVYVIGRYNYDAGRIKNIRGLLTINYLSGAISYETPRGQYAGKKITLKFVTAHKSKGLEADYTIILNCNSGGFPAEKADDPLLNLLLSSADQFENGEERRVFYVAMTRTKTHVIFIAERSRKSKFIKELQDEDETRDARCPKCGNGELIKRSGAGYLFYGCSNFSYGCDYTTSTPPVVNMPVAANETEVKSNQDKPALTTQSKTQSILTTSQQNKLEYFCKNPKLYAGSEKAREKVAYLETIVHKFNSEEKAKFDTAYAVWKANLS